MPTKRNPARFLKKLYFACFDFGKLCSATKVDNIFCVVEIQISTGHSLLDNGNK